MGLTKEELAKEREGFAKLKENVATLTAKAKKTVQQVRKSGPGALKKGGTALMMERDRFFQDYDPGAEKPNKAVRNYYHLRGKGAAKTLVSPQEDFCSLDRIVPSTGIPEVTGAAPTQAHCFAIQVLPPSPRGQQVPSGPTAAKG